MKKGYRYPPITPGPFKADQVREGDPYEISRGHAIYCLPTGARGSEAAATGAAVLKSDPDVESAGVETGYSPSPDVLRAPDVAVGNVPAEPGWVKGVPPLAVEYADTGQDEYNLQQKIDELLGAGTLYIWVVRMNGPRRVEVYEPGRPMRVVRPGEELTAPGVLRNPVPVEALYDWRVGQQITLRNLLQRQGYGNLEEVRAEARAEVRAEAIRESILTVLDARGLEVSPEIRDALAACGDPETLRRYQRAAVTVASAADLLKTILPDA